MARKVIDIIYNLVRKRKTLTESGPGSKVISLPDEDSIKRGMEDVFERLRDGGYNVVSADKAIKTEADLARILEEINQAVIKQNKERLDAADALETIQYKLQNNIPLNPEDQKKLLGSGFKTASEAFQGFKPKIIEGGKKEGIEQLLKEGKITKGTAPKTTKKKPAVDPELQKSEDLKKEFKDFEDRTEIKDLDDEPDGLAMGGIAKTRIGMNIGGRLLKFLSENSPFQAYKKYLKSVKRRAQTEPEKLAPELGAVTAGGIFTNRRVKDILEQGNLEQKEKFLNEYIEQINEDPFYKDRPELKDKMIEKYTERMFGEKKAMGGLMRLGLKEGGGMTRRTFLKILGGLASIPVVGKLFKGAKPAAKVVETIKQSPEVPSYFPKLVEKIITKGDDITSPAVTTAERQKVYQYKDYTLTQSMDTGAITIDKSTEGGGMFKIGDQMEYESGIVKQERMEYVPPQVDVDPIKKKTIKYPAEYEEITVKPDFEGKMKDVDFGLDSYEEILEEVGESKIKKAGGGLAYMLGE